MVMHKKPKYEPQIEGAQKTKNFYDDQSWDLHKKLKRKWIWAEYF